MFPTQTEKNVAMMALLVQTVKLVVKVLDVNQTQNVSHQSPMKCAVQYLLVQTKNVHNVAKAKLPVRTV